jgi:hypothetical protein
MARPPASNLREILGADFASRLGGFPFSSYDFVGLLDESQNCATKTAPICEAPRQRSSEINKEQGNEREHEIRHITKTLHQ